VIEKEIDLKINFDMFPTSNKTIEAKALVLRENEKYRMLYIPKIVDRGDDWNNSITVSNTSELNAKQIESFNLFRNELRMVEVITYDELLSKMEILYKVLGGKDD
jgi:hypothetical protein